MLVVEFSAKQLRSLVRSVQVTIDLRLEVWHKIGNDSTSILQYCLLGNHK
jgi:hypothetical protein